MESNHTHWKCQACSAVNTGRYELKCEVRGEYFGNRVTFQECANCAFTYAPSNTYRFDSESDFCDSSRPLEKPGRAGTETRAGREFHMAVMSEDILEDAGICADSILIYGAGLSRDHVQLARRFPKAKVCVCDLMNFQETPNFVSLDSREQFDIVVACEVVEHFTEIEVDFSILLGKASDRGIVILSTNISDGSPLSEMAYPFIPGHTVYYSGRSLQLIAERFDPKFNVDFRPPAAASAQLGPRKRYVLMYRDHKIPRSISCYFSKHFMAPSEATVRLPPHRRWLRFLQRKFWAGMDVAAGRVGS